ncbi:peptidoglycan-binding protein [Inquilinus sp. Marseille-Q2685]|uniref:peptidoglycan-binding domain-containing protein n=1 Tax=Inquilinus sp. Marseille-Q2685 TaxID=2866581 RepID=UPI001CE45CF8|nr:peptidoglycan-binding domain-containing protein [Inquilinus sp. Marseille-Q2685]
MRSFLALACLAATAGWAGTALAANIEPGTYAASGGAAIRLLVEPTQDGSVAFLLHRSTRGGICLMSGMAKPVGDTITWTSNSGAALAIRFDGRGATIDTANALPKNCDGAPRLAGSYVYDSPAIDFDRAEIGAVQSALNGAGYRLGQVDGILGQRSLAAVRDYQQKNNLPSPNGGLTVETVAHLASGGRTVAATPGAPTPIAPATPPAQGDAGAAAPAQTDTAEATPPSAPTPGTPPPPLRWLNPIPDRLIPLLESRYAPMVAPAVINWRDAPFQVAEMELDEKPGQLTPDVIVFWNDAKHCDANGCPWEILAEGSQSLTPVADGKAHDLGLAPSYSAGKRDLLIDGNRLFRWTGKGWAPEYYKPEKVR